MLKKQLVIALIGISTVILLFVFGRTVPHKSNSESPPISAAKTFDIQQFIAEEKNHLGEGELVQVSKLENSVTRGDVNSQLVNAFNALADFWKGHDHSPEIYFYYLSEAAKLDKSEKSLTFAAQLILDNLRAERDQAKLIWKTEQAIALFEKAVALYPENDDHKVGLGSCYVFGSVRTGGPQEAMKGIQQLLAVVQKDSNNMKAQMMLGVGGYVSGQYDKAVERLLKVVTRQPDNMEAIAFLADTYAAKGDKAEAIKWYQLSKRLINDPHYSKEVDERIRLLR